MSGRPWTDADLRTLRTLRGRFSNAIIATQLGRSKKAVSRKGAAMDREDQRVEMARKARSVSRFTAEASP